MYATKAKNRYRRLEKIKWDEKERERQLELEQKQSLMEELSLTESRMDDYEQSSRKMETKRKQDAPKRKAMKRKLEPLKGWGEGLEDEALGRWLEPSRRLDNEEQQYDWE